VIDLSNPSPVDVVIIGAGVAGLSAGIYTGRAGLETELVNTGTSILNRNAHLENYPGFPAGINPRLLLEMMQDQARRSGCEFTSKGVLDISVNSPFEVTLQGGVSHARKILISSWSDVSYTEDLGLKCYSEETKTFLETDDRGETSIDGIYAAGRVAGARHQSLIAAGDGADVGLSIVESLEPDFYHDWVAPEGYFTDRGREIPPGCEEISDPERRRRARKAQEELRDYLEDAPDEGPKPHPSLVDEEANR
jgi:thioredoxin reductase (NADPH)